MVLNAATVGWAVAGLWRWAVTLLMVPCLLAVAFAGLMAAEALMDPDFDELMVVRQHRGLPWWEMIIKALGVLAVLLVLCLPAGAVTSLWTSDLQWLIFGMSGLVDGGIAWMFRISLDRQESPLPLSLRGSVRKAEALARKAEYHARYTEASAKKAAERTESPEVYEEYVRRCKAKDRFRAAADFTEDDGYIPWEQRESIIEQKIRSHPPYLQAVAHAEYEATRAGKAAAEARAARARATAMTEIK